MIDINKKYRTRDGREARVIWVNEYEQGLSAYRSKEKAEELALSPIRTAVKYIEAGMTPKRIISEHCAAIGRKGGKATGKRKARTSEQARKAAKTRWAKRKEKKVNHTLPNERE